MNTPSSRSDRYRTHQNRMGVIVRFRIRKRRHISLWRLLPLVERSEDPGLVSNTNRWTKVKTHLSKQRHFRHRTLIADIGDFRLPEKSEIQLDSVLITASSTLFPCPPDWTMSMGCFNKQWTYFWQSQMAIWPHTSSLYRHVSTYGWRTYRPSWKIIDSMTLTLKKCKLFTNWTEYLGLCHFRWVLQSPDSNDWRHTRNVTVD